MIGKLKKFKDSNTGDYLYPITVSDAVYVDSTTSLKDKLQDLNTTMGKVLGSYVLDLGKWGLNNNSVDFNDVNIARANSIGINAAIQWASQKGYSEIIFPSGIYLIHEYTPIIPVDFMTINLGGATLRIRNNAFDHYHVIRIAQDQVNVRITNGKIRGDRYDHTFPAGSGTHEGCVGISVGSHQEATGSPKNIVLDNLEIYEHTGDSIAIATHPNFQSGFNLSNWEQGSIDTITGASITDTSKIRITNKMMLNKPDIIKYGYFLIGGNGWGDFGGQITTEVCDIIFYNSSDVFVSSIKAVKYFDDIVVPSGASYAKIVLYQSNIPDPAVTNNVVLSICVPLSPRYVFIENCHLHHSKRCGISGGGKYIFVRDSEINDILGTAPQSAIDIEDGYGLNQYQCIQNNYLHDCKVGLSFVSTKHVFVTGNVIDRLGIGTVWGECVNVIINNNHILRSSFDLQGETIFTNNTVYGGSVSVRKISDCIVSDNYFHNSSLNVTKDLPYKAIIDNCRFYHDADSLLMPNQQPTLFYGKEPQTISNCTFIGKTSALTTVSGDANAYDWNFLGNTFSSTKGVTLPSGVIRGCTFDNQGSIGLSHTITTAFYDFSDCTFKNYTVNQFFIPVEGNMNMLRVRNCRFTCNGNSSAAYFRNITGRLEFINNAFEYNNATSDFAIIDFVSSLFTCKQLIVDGNEFTSNRALTAVNLSRHKATDVIIFKNNILNTVIQTISTVNNAIYTDNNYINGVYDALKHSSSPPIRGYYKIGAIFYNAIPTPSGTLGWVCTTAGYASSAVWSTGGYYNVGDRIKDGNHVYEVISGGNPSGTKPTFPTASGSQVVDGKVVWKEIGILAVFSVFGNII